MNYYIADLHFGHSNVIKYDKRPFETVQEMDNQLINNWNNKVSPNDTVYILGDFSWYNKEITINIINKLKGNKIFILGNHDKPIIQLFNFNKLYNYLEISDCNKNIILSHYPIASYNGMYRNSILLYGHIHNGRDHIAFEKYKLDNNIINAHNVGCMIPIMNYTPRSLKEIINN